MQNEVLNHCRDLIKQGKTAASLDMLADYCKQSAADHHDAVVLLSAQWKQYQNKHALGLSDDTTIPNRITHAVLEIIRDLEHTQPRRRIILTRSLLIGVSVLCVILILIWAQRRPPDNVNTTHGNQSPILQNSPGAILEFHNTPDTNAIPNAKK
jgi:hypothetical protein